jgi:hypothetical protein
MENIFDRLSILMCLTVLTRDTSWRLDTLLIYHLQPPITPPVTVLRRGLGIRVGCVSAADNAKLSAMTYAG